MPISKLFSVLEFCGFPRFLDAGKGRGLPWGDQCLTTGLDYVFVVFLYVMKDVLGIRWLVVSLFRRCITFCKKCNFIQFITLAEMISDLDGSLGSRYFLNVTNERTCFASCAYTFSGLITCLECTSD